MKIQTIKTYSPSFSMKFSPEIEQKYLEEKSALKDDELSKKILTEAKNRAAYIIEPYFRDRSDIKYGSIKKVNGKNNYYHTLNIGQRTYPILGEKNTNLYNFFNYIIWHPGEEIMEGIALIPKKKLQRKY